MFCVLWVRGGWWTRHADHEGEWVRVTHRQQGSWSELWLNLGLQATTKTRASQELESESAFWKVSMNFDGGLLAWLATLWPSTIHHSLVGQSSARLSSVIIFFTDCILLGLFVLLNSAFCLSSCWMFVCLWFAGEKLVFTTSSILAKRTIIYYHNRICIFHASIGCRTTTRHESTSYPLLPTSWSWSTESECVRINTNLHHETVCFNLANHCSERARVCCKLSKVFRVFHFVVAREQRRQSNPSFGQLRTTQH